MRTCPSPKKMRELDFVIETLTELDERRKQKPRAGPPNRVAYGQRTRDVKETARPARRQPTKFNNEGARVAVQEDECSVCSDDEYAGSILPAPARQVARAASARATTASAGRSGPTFTGLSAGELFDDEGGETDEEGAFDAFTVHHAYLATPAAIAPELAAPLAIDLPAPAVVPVLAAPLGPFVAELDGPEPDVNGLLVPTNRSRRANATWNVAVESIREDSAWHFEDEHHHEHAHAHDDSDPFIHSSCTTTCSTRTMATPTRSGPCGKQWQSCGLARCAVQQEELPEAQRAARRGRSQSSGRRARCGQRVRSAQTAGRCNGDEQENERRSTRRNTPNKSGTRNSTNTNNRQGGARAPHGV